MISQCVLYSVHNGDKWIANYLFLFQVSGNDIFQQTKILMGLVVVFVFCQCFTIVADVYELICTVGSTKGTKSANCPSNTHIENFISWGHLMLAINSSVNFIFYMIHIREFRDSFFRVMSFSFFFHKSILILWLYFMYDMNNVPRKELRQL